MSVEEKLRELGLELPSAPPPAANYKRCVRAGNLAFFSGQLPWVEGKMRYAGHVGSDLSDEEGYEAAKLCALNALAQIKARRYHEPYLADPRRIILLGAGGFKERAIRCLWEDIER